MASARQSRYVLRQTGVFYEFFHNVPKAGGFLPGDEKDFDPGAAVLRALIGGRLQKRDIEKLIRTKRFEEGENTQRLRFAIKRAVARGDEKEAETLAAEYVARMRLMFEVGMIDMVPKQLRGKFRRELAERRRLRDPQALLFGSPPASRGG